jgi:hypothetical protein
MPRFRLTVVATVAAALGLVAWRAAPREAAQVVTVDEGSFTITRNGERVGREDFRIRRSDAAGGGAYMASATVAYGQRRIFPDLEADANGMPLSYRVEVKNGDATEERLTGQGLRGRFSAQLKTARGEATREYVMPAGALVLDDSIFHQYYFAARGDRTGPTPVVIPRRNAQLTMRVERMGSEWLALRGRSVQATHVVLSDGGTGSRDVWVDAAGRVLKVAVPSQGVVAERDDIPPR